MSTATYTIEEIRHAWEAGFKLCRTYGDNWHHWDGAQKERTWDRYLESCRSAPPSAPSPLPAEPESFGAYERSQAITEDMNATLPASGANRGGSRQPVLPHVGHDIIEEIVKRPLVRSDSQQPHVLIWTVDAPELLAKLVYASADVQIPTRAMQLFGEALSRLGAPDDGNPSGLLAWADATAERLKALHAPDTKGGEPLEQLSGEGVSDEDMAVFFEAHKAFHASQNKHTQFEYTAAGVIAKYRASLMRRVARHAPSQPAPRQAGGELRKALEKIAAIPTRTLREVQISEIAHAALATPTLPSDLKQPE